MDTPPLTRPDLATMETPSDPASETPRARAGCVPCLEIGGQWARALAERWSLAHESGPAEEMVLRPGSDLDT